MYDWVLQIYNQIIYFLKLTLEIEVFWSVLPLALATIFIVTYFSRYEDEGAGWNTYLSNSLVLIFVSMNLFRYIYQLDLGGIDNFIHYYQKSVATVFLLLIGSFLVRINFGHVFPEKFAKYLSSIVTINLIAYVIILFVFSTKAFSWIIFISLLLIITILSLIFELIKIPLRKFFDYIEKQKQKEELKHVKEQKFQIDELKNELKKRKKNLKKTKLKKANQDKDKAVKIKEEIRKIESKLNFLSSKKNNKKPKKKSPKKKSKNKLIDEN